MPSSRLVRFLTIFVLLSSAAVVVAAQEDDDVDRTDFSDPALQEDKVSVATGPHSEVESAFIFPENPDAKVPIGTSTDLLLALTNSGGKMFNISRVEARLLNAAGKTAYKLPTFEHGEPLGPREQRSYRYPLSVDADAALGDYTLVAKAFYNNREKDQFFSVFYNDTVTLVPKPADKVAQARMVQMGLAGLGGLVLLVAASKALGGGAAAAKPKPAKKAAGGNEWLSGTLAGTEGAKKKGAKKL